MKNVRKVLATVLLVCMVCSMMVVPAAAGTVGGTEVTLNRYALPLVPGEVYDLTATVAPEVVTETNLLWSSSNEAVAAVDANGVVTALAVGSAVVTATTADGLYSAACEVVVADTVVPATGISLDMNEFSMDLGGAVALSPTVYPENASIKSLVWLSSDENVVSVDENGNIFGLAAGSAVITVWAAELDLSAAPLNEALMAKCQVYVIDRAAEEAARIAAEQAAAEEAARIAAEQAAAEEAARIAAEQAAAEEAARIAAEQAAAEEAARIAAEQAAAEEAARIAAEQAAAEEAARIAAEQAAAEEAARIAAEQAAAEEAARIAAEQAAKDTLVLPTVGVSSVDSPMYLTGAPLPAIVTNYAAMEMSTLELGDTYALSASLSDGSMPPVGYTWESSDPNVVSVAVPGDSAYCTLTVVGAGTAVVTVSRGEYATPTDINVVVYNDTVTITDSRSTMLTGESYTFAAEGKWGSKAVNWSSSNPAVAAVDANGLVYAAGAGEAVITAVSAGDRAATPASAGVTVTVSAPPPAVISVTGVSLDRNTLALTTGGYYDLTASASPENATNRNVVWSSSDSTVASVDANGVVTALKAGTTTVTATTVDGGFTASCAVTVTDPAPTVVPVTGVSFDKNNVTLIPGGTATVIATVSPAEASNKALSWASTDSSIASVSDGVIIAHKVGAVTVTATAQDGSGCYAACTVTVSDISVTLDKSSFQLALGSVEAFVLKATVSPETVSNKTVTWSSSDPAVATVDQTGKVIAVSAGTAVITATSVEGGKTASCTVSVKAKPAVDIQCAYENPSFLSNEGTYSGITAVIKDNALPAGNFLWSSSDESIVTVTGSGTNNATCIVTIKGKVGSAVITASHAGCDADTISINVVAPTNVPVTGVTITGSGNSTTVGGTLQLGAVVTPDNASNKAVTWSSGNTSVATVDQTGKVTGISVGTANITAAAQDGSGKSYTVAISVAAAPNGILYVSSNVNTISSAGGTALLTARLANNSIVPNASISWTVSPADMASVSVNGVVTPKRVGSFTITGTFSAGGVNYTGSTTIRMAPAIIYGNNSSYNGDNNPLYFVSNDLSSNARSVRVDGYTLTHGQHCYIYDHQGYIAVALNPAYLRSLSPSVVHTIQIDSANGTATGYFRIYGYSSSIYGVQTGDENQAALWAALLLVSVMGMGTVLISRRKEWNS